MGWWHWEGSRAGEGGKREWERLRRQWWGLDDNEEEGKGEAWALSGKEGGEGWCYCDGDEVQGQKSDGDIFVDDVGERDRGAGCGK